MGNSNDKDPQTGIEDFRKAAAENSNDSSDPQHYKISDTVELSSPEQTAAYLADMLREMQSMAEKSGHRSLGEMLEYAHREAVWRSRSGDVTDAEPK